MDPPKLLQFPCTYPIKVMARAEGGLRPQLDEVIARHAGEAALVGVQERPSAQHRFVSVTYTIEAQSEGQVAGLFEDLKKIPAVLLVI